MSDLRAQLSPGGDQQAVIADGPQPSQFGQLRVVGHASQRGAGVGREPGSPQVQGEFSCNERHASVAVHHLQLAVEAGGCVDGVLVHLHREDQGRVAGNALVFEDGVLRHLDIGEILRAQLTGQRPQSGQELGGGLLLCGANGSVVQGHAQPHVPHQRHHPPRHLPLLRRVQVHHRDLFSGQSALERGPCVGGRGRIDGGR